MAALSVATVSLMAVAQHQGTASRSVLKLLKYNCLLLLLSNSWNVELPVTGPTIFLSGIVRVNQKKKSFCLGQPWESLWTDGLFLVWWCELFQFSVAVMWLLKVNVKIMNWFPYRHHDVYRVNLWPPLQVEKPQATHRTMATVDQRETKKTTALSSSNLEPEDDQPTMDLEVWSWLLGKYFTSTLLLCYVNVSLHFIIFLYAYYLS